MLGNRMYAASGLNGHLVWGTPPFSQLLICYLMKRTGRQVVKSTDVLDLGGPPLKNSTFFAATDTSSCRFPSSLNTDEFRNYTGLLNCCYWVEQALLGLSSWPHHCPECHRGREKGRKIKKHLRPWGVEYVQRTNSSMPWRHTSANAKEHIPKHLIKWWAL